MVVCEKNMNPCFPNFKISPLLIDKTNRSANINQQIMHKNKISNQPTEIKCENVTDTNKLKEILQTVSILYPMKSTETAGCSNDDDCEIIYDCSKKSDSDEIEIVNEINHNRTNELSSNKIDSVNSANIPLEKCPKPPENVTDSSIIQNASKNDICENIGSVDIQIIQNRNIHDICENTTNSIDIQEIQNINENDACKNMEIAPEDDSKNDLCEVPASEHADTDAEIISLKCSETDFLTESNTMDRSHLNSNSSEKCVVENTTDTVEVKDLENSEDNGMCDENMDVTDESSLCTSYEIEYDFKSGPPTQITGSWREFSVGKKNNFTKGCKWAPDGSCIMTCSDDNKLRIFNLPSELWDSSHWFNISEMEAVLKISEGDLIYDYCWYPLMNSNDPSTCCLASVSRKNTVHLWDAYSGELRCSYRSFNHLDELVTPHSLCFDSDGEKLFCGFHNVIRVFDVNRPGRIFEERKIYGYKTGQCGIISCFAFTSSDKNISAAGSYQKSIGLYAEPYGELSCLLEGQGNGITQLQFSPDGKYLYSGGRKDSKILCWDLRNLGEVLFSLRRSCDTNQRIQFDISRCGKYVVSGNQNGVITFWDVTSEPKEIEKSYFSVLVPDRFYLAHDDCVNGVNFHPFYPLLCSSSGQRKFPELLDDDDSQYMFSYDKKKQDNSLRLWWIGKLDK